IPSAKPWAGKAPRQADARSENPSSSRQAETGDSPLLKSSDGGTPDSVGAWKTSDPPIRLRLPKRTFLWRGPCVLRGLDRSGPADGRGSLVLSTGNHHVFSFKLRNST